MEGKTFKGKKKDGKRGFLSLRKDAQKENTKS